MEQQPQQQGDSELLGQSMLRMIRSARHRLHREASHGPGSSHGSFCSEAVLHAAPGHLRTVRSVTKTEPVLLSRGGGSENAGLAVVQLASARGERPPVLGDVTNFTNQRPPLSRRPSLGDAVCSKPPVAEPLTARVPPSAAPSPLPSHRDVDVDKAHAEDPQHCSEYTPDIYGHMQQQEGQHLPDPAYMDRQPQVTPRMRAILVDWLVDVHKKYKLKPLTLFIAISILDRFLEKRTTLRRHLQLVGVSALLIAAKFEEIYPPQINDFVYVTDKAYTREEVMRMEVSILTVLEFHISVPTSVHFLERYQAVNGCNETHRELAQYLLELTLGDYRMLKYSPSHLAASAVLLSNSLARRQPVWSPAAIKHTKLSEVMLRECSREICTLLEHIENNPLQAVRKKFLQAKHHSVAKAAAAGLPPSLPPPPLAGQSPATSVVQSPARSEEAPVVTVAVAGTVAQRGLGRRSGGGAARRPIR